MSLFENPTQTMGIIAFLSTFLSCVLAGRFATWTIWRWLAAIYLFFVLEIALGWRHGLRLVVNDALQSLGIYGHGRHGYGVVGSAGYLFFFDLGSET